MSRLKDYSESSERLSGEMYGETFRKAYDRDYQGINPRKQARDRRLINEALIFLQNQESIKNPARAMKALFSLYEEIDSSADYIKAGEREFFPVDKSERTIERFLEGFRYIYFILKRAQERIYLTSVFDNFWEQCNQYLRRCGYSESFISRVCSKEDLFYRQSFNYWRKEFGDSEEAFPIMNKYFKACFGIKGNDEYCLTSKGLEMSYDWKKMASCHEKFYKKQFFSDPVLIPPDYVPPSKSTLDKLNQLIIRRKQEITNSKTMPDLLLLDIQKRNEEKGYFQKL